MKYFLFTILLCIASLNTFAHDHFYYGYTNHCRYIMTPRVIRPYIPPPVYHYPIYVDRYYYVSPVVVRYYYQPTVYFYYYR